MPLYNSQDTIYTYEGKKFIINNPYKDGGSLSLKGQMHCHTTNSDGTNTPTALVTSYEAAGYDFITITDHDYITTDPSVAGITWLGNSVEESTGRHVIAYDVSTQTTSADVQTVINFHRDLGRMANIAHPSWTGHYIMNESDMQSYYDFNFIEVYNATVNEYGDTIWDYALSSGKKTFALSVDDCHNTAGADFNKGWVVVKSNADTATDIKASLRKGNFYASTGNDIAIAVSGNVVTASSAGSSNFTFYGRNGLVLKTENGVTSSQYTILGNEMYVRVKSVKVSDSTIAWSQPVFVDVIGDDDERLSRITDSGWRKISETTLASPADIITVDNIRPCSYLKIDFVILCSSGTSSKRIRFNNDSGSNYNVTYSVDSAAATHQGADTSYIAGTTSGATYSYGTIFITNVASQLKMGNGQTLQSSGTVSDATLGSVMVEYSGWWNNTSAQITRVDLVNTAGTGDFATGSKVTISGMN